LRNSGLIYSLLIATASILLFSCKSDKGEGQADEGIIEFVTTPTNKADPLYDLAPNEATLKFKDGKFLMTMSVMGVFNTSLIGDTRAKTLTQTVRFMNIKQYCIEREKHIEESNNDYQLKFEETNETREIVGLKCYKVRVTKIKDPGDKFDIWYTKDLGMEDSNILTPYADIKGVLIDYRIKKMGLELRFLARSYRNVKVPDSEFKIADNLKEVSREEMARIFTEL
jgi:hypothetical protein